uniref:Uncharacterized protein n=1 Tax=Rhizophora mucronata TaxID=61149 RepID=A0A2P2Q6I6_RHIMU
MDIDKSNSQLLYRQIINQLSFPRTM